MNAVNCCLEHKLLQKVINSCDDAHKQKTDSKHALNCSCAYEIVHLSKIQKENLKKVRNAFAVVINTTPNSMSKKRSEFNQNEVQIF